MDYTSVSILMPIYNGIEFIDESVTSVIQQTYTSWELIIGINGHPFNSIVYQKAKEYEMKDKRIRVIEFPMETIIGKSNTLNAMIPFCHYDWISLLDVDDIWNNKKLEYQMPFTKEYDVIGTRAIYFGDTSLHGHIPNIPTGDISVIPSFLDGNPIINSSVLLKKELCHWDANTVLEDYDLWLKLRYITKCRFYNCFSVLVKHRLHDDSAFNSKGNSSGLHALKEMYKIYNK